MASLLLIEPDRQSAAIYAAALRSAGYAVTICATAQQAIAAADDEHPDIVVLELQLVAHSGIEFLYEFRSYPDWMSVPLIVHTHVPPSEFEGSRDVLMHELGAQAYLYKPQTNLQQLVRAVGELVPVQ